MIKAIIFDLDDTLHSTRKYALECFKPVSKRLEKKKQIISDTFYLELVKNYDEGFRFDLIERTLNRFEIYNKDILHELIEVYRLHKTQKSLYNDSLPVLELLQKNKELHTFLVTDGRIESQKSKIESMDIEKYFDDIIYTYAMGEKNKKPSPVSFIELFSKKAFCSSEVMAIGDNCYRDFICLKKMKTLTLRIIREDGPYSMINVPEEFNAHYEIKSLKEIFFYLEKMNDK